MDIVITFPSGKKVNANFEGFVVRTDQSIDDGGCGEAPDPFSLFLSSIGTCTGIYVLRFCEQRNISTDDMSLLLKTSKGDDGLIDTITLLIRVGQDFPKKYMNALIKAASLCTVKRQLVKPPTIQISVQRERI
ncbi:MAG: OsmC family protein [Candidatus Thermoplasmatota archaeon]|nr:OsmC family protein [Candidatus Thermoplasmatota archaeon]